MVSKICEYSVEGYSIFRRCKIRQEGEVSYFSDGKLIGLVSDSCEHLVSDSCGHLVSTNLFLGVYLPEDSSLAFLKLPPINPEQVFPILFSMASEKLNKSPNPLGTYSGLWSVVRNLPLIGNLEEVLDENPIKINRKLEKLPVEDLIRNYFNPRILSDVESSALKTRQKGRLTFVEK